MISKIINRLMGKSSPKPSPKFGQRRVITEQDHGIDHTLVDERAMNVVRTLQERGFEAYIVGGAVRDLLVGLKPKDFDVATNATPEEVKACFRRAFIIGRRFRIVHVVYGRGREHEVIEVSTFRAYLDSNDAEQVSGNERTSKKALSIMLVVVFGVGQLIEGFVLTPRLVGERIGLHPLAVIFALLAFGQLLGFVGVLMALPASAVLLVALRRLRERYMASRLYAG